MVNMARPQGLVLTAEEGYSRLRSEIDAGALIRLRRGAYLAEASPDARGPGDEWAQRAAVLLARCHATAHALRSRFAFSHGTAAFLHGWPGPMTDAVHVLMPVRASARHAADIVRHHTAELAEEDVVEIDGLPVTGPARTALDCALLCAPPQGLAVVDAALRALASVSRFERDLSVVRQDAVRADLQQRLEARGSVRHARRARDVLRYADGLSESGGESWMRWLALSRGMPVPALQVPIATGRGTFYPDALWRFDGGHGPVLAEYDGREKYDGDGELALIAEKDREQLLVDATGGRIVRFTHRDMTHPDAAFARLLRATPLRAGDLEPRPDLLPRRQARP